MLSKPKKTNFVKPNKKMEELVKRFREGDKSSFEELFRAFFTAGRRFVLSFLNDEAGADDILQEVFIQIWNKRQIFKDEAHFKAYFYKALRNNTIKKISRDKKPLEIERAEHKESDDLFVLVAQTEFNREVARAISQLPEKRRHIILMSMTGMSADEIAGALNITVNTVKSQKTKAYNFLRQELKNIDKFLTLIL